MLLKADGVNGFGPNIRLRKKNKIIAPPGLNLSSWIKSGASTLFHNVSAYHAN
ncbi:hypothetical protein D1BOALGB6SA_3742 [Olavius sp. associated proteobacterium Delta 1]|nr:hypothetical protein D1BOALGB6SA_3742 [Olavius sp. associated proteobacterium Delta 1]